MLYKNMSCRGMFCLWHFLILFHAQIVADGSLKVGVTISSAATASKQANRADVDSINKKMKEFSDNDSEPNEPLEDVNFNSNNGNDLDDEDFPMPTICVYGNSGMAGPLDLDITKNNELSEDSQCECNVRTFTGILCYCTVYIDIRILSVRPFVHLSVTFQYCITMA